MQYYKDTLGLHNRKELHANTSGLATTTGVGNDRVEVTHDERDGAIHADRTDLVGKSMETVEAWRSIGQQYHVEMWTTIEGEIQFGKPGRNGGDLNCMWKSDRVVRKMGNEDFDNEDGEKLICAMRGNDWESLPYPIVVDSGASASILPKEWCQHVKLWEADGSKSGQSFNAANGLEIPNFGRRVVTFMIRGGSHPRHEIRGL